MAGAIENSKFRVIGNFDRKDNLVQFCHDTLDKKDILFFVESTSGENIEFIIQFHHNFPDVRIIYISPDIDLTNITFVDRLCQLIDNGIYDIYYGETINKQMIQDFLINPRTRDYNQPLLVLRKRNREAVFRKYEEPEKESSKESKNESKEAADLFSNGYDNVVVVSSIKPGSGKSFISTNIAAGIAKYGKAKFNGDKPKVAIIEGDLQTLAVGTLLGVRDEKYNLKTALDKVATVMDDEGNFIGDEEDHEQVKKFIMKCFLPYEEINNLYVLAASQVNFDEWVTINPYHYFYLIESIIDEFDVIIIDSNSSLEHKTTAPVLQLANICLYVIDLEYNNIRMNIRYQQTLRELGILKKVHYVLNRDISKSIARKFAEPLEYDADSLAKDFHVIGRIPLVDASIILNRLRRKRPIVLDTTSNSIEARMEFTNICDKIWPMDNILSLKMEKAMLTEKTNS